MKTSKKKTLPAIEVSLFCNQTAMILKSGIPLYDGMEALYDNYKDTEYAGTFKTIYEGVRDGGTLYDGVSAAGIFPDYMVQMIKAGETAGQLDAVLEQLAEYYEKEDRIQSSIRSAVTYPLVLIAMLTVVIGILVIKALPVFTDVFRSLGAGYSDSSGAVLSAGVTLGRIILIIAAVLMVFIIAVFCIWKSGGKGVVLNAAEKIFPPFRRIMRKRVAQRFASVVSMVLCSGCNIESAFEILPKLVENKSGAAKIEKCGKLLAENGDLSAAAESSEIFDPLHMKMIKVGIQAGQTDRVLEKVSDICERDIEEDIQSLTSRIEPALVAVLTVIIGGILLSVMLPLMSIMSSMG